MRILSATGSGATGQQLKQMKSTNAALCCNRLKMKPALMLVALVCILCGVAAVRIHGLEHVSREYVVHMMTSSRVVSSQFGELVTPDTIITRRDTPPTVSELLGIDRPVRGRVRERGFKDEAAVHTQQGFQSVPSFSALRSTCMAIAT